MTKTVQKLSPTMEIATTASNLNKNMEARRLAEKQATKEDQRLPMPPHLEVRM